MDEILLENRAAPMSDLAASLRDVHKNYGEGSTLVRALDGVDLEVRRGELLLLVGPSGCGKTTLLSVLCGILDATSGAIEVFGTRQNRRHARWPHPRGAFPAGVCGRRRTSAIGRWPTGSRPTMMKKLSIALPAAGVILLGILLVVNARKLPHSKPLIPPPSSPHANTIAAFGIVKATGKIKAFRQPWQV